MIFCPIKKQRHLAGGSREDGQLKLLHDLRPVAMDLFASALLNERLKGRLGWFTRDVIIITTNYG